MTVSVSARALFRIATSLALRASDRVITISDAARRDLLSQFEVDPALVTTIHLAAADTFSPTPDHTQARLRAKYELRGDYVLYLGSNKPHKNLVRLVDAYASVSSQWPADSGSLPVLIVAGAWDNRYPEAKTSAEIHKLGDSIRFLGPVDDADLPDLYTAATAFVFPSRYEGFGLPVLEAMACGAPVACSHSSSLPEVAGAAAFFFDPEETESIAQAIRVLVTDVHLRRTLSEMGLRRSRQFSWKHTAGKTIDLYRDLLPTRETL